MIDNHNLLTGDGFMDEATMIALIVSILTGLAGVCTVVTFIIKTKKSGYTDGKDNGEIRGDIKYIRNSFDDLRLDVKEVARKQDSQSERIAKVEERCNQMDKSIEKLDAKVDHLSKD